MVKNHRVHLTGGDQKEMKVMVSKGREAAYRETHARIMLLCDENQDGGAMRDVDIVRALKVGTATEERVLRLMRFLGLPSTYRQLGTIWPNQVRAADIIHLPMVWVFLCLVAVDGMAQPVSGVPGGCPKRLGEGFCTEALTDALDKG